MSGLQAVRVQEHAQHDLLLEGRSGAGDEDTQGRLPQELRLRGIHTWEAANRFLREHYIAEFNARFQVPAAQRGSAFVGRSGRDLDLFFVL